MAIKIKIISRWINSERFKEAVKQVLKERQMETQGLSGRKLISPIQPLRKSSI